MSASSNRHYRVLDVAGRHFVQSGKAAGLGPTLMKEAITDIIDRAKNAPSKALSQMPEDFAQESRDSIVATMPTRLRLLETAFEELKLQTNGVCHDFCHDFSWVYRRADVTCRNPQISAVLD